MTQAKRTELRRLVAEINTELKNKRTKMLLDVEFSDGLVKFNQATPEQLEKNCNYAHLFSARTYKEANFYLKGYFHSLRLINWK